MEIKSGPSRNIYYIDIAEYRIWYIENRTSGIENRE